MKSLPVSWIHYCTSVFLWNTFSASVLVQLRSPVVTSALVSAIGLTREAGMSSHRDTIKDEYFHHGSLLCF